MLQNFAENMHRVERKIASGLVHLEKMKKSGNTTFIFFSEILIGLSPPSWVG